MASIFENARHGRALAQALDAFAQVPLLRTGLRLGLFEALRTPQDPRALADRLGLAPDLVAAWARNLQAQGWLQKAGRKAPGAPGNEKGESEGIRRSFACRVQQPGRGGCGRIR